MRTRGPRSCTACVAQVSGVRAVGAQGQRPPDKLAMLVIFPHAPVACVVCPRRQDLDLHYEPEEGQQPKQYYTYRVRVSNCGYGCIAGVATFCLSIQLAAYLPCSQGGAGFAAPAPRGPCICRPAWLLRAAPACCTCLHASAHPQLPCTCPVMTQQ